MPTFRVTFVRALGKSGSGLATITTSSGQFTNADSFVAIEATPEGLADIEAATLSDGGLTFTATTSVSDITAQLNSALSSISSSYAAALTAPNHKATPEGCVPGSTGAYTYSLYPSGGSAGPYPVTLVSNDTNYECALHYLLGVEKV